MTISKFIWVKLESLVYNMVCGLLQVMTFGFFRELAEYGSKNIPSTGAVIITAAPHANQFVDPMVMILACPGPIRFLIAAKFLDKGVPGILGRLIGAIPVQRPTDLGIKGKGKIKLDQEDHGKIIGIDTKFKEELKPNTTLIGIPYPPKDFTSVVERIESEDILFLKSPLEGKAADRLLVSPESSCFAIVPVVEQPEVYNSVFRALSQGECLGIFPEGFSHDQPEMLPFKAGVTIMALGAMSLDPDLEITIVPCGLNYFNPEKFRSRATLQYGNPFKVDRKLVELFKMGSKFRREACGKLLEQIREGLYSVSINSPDFETLQVVQASRRLYQGRPRMVNSSDLLKLTRNLIQMYGKFKDDPKISLLRKSVLEYDNLLKHFRLWNHQVESMAEEEGNFTRAIMLIIMRISLLVTLGLIILPIILLNLPTMPIIAYFSSKKATQAVQSFSAKLTGRDVLATWKIAMGFCLLPPLYILYTIPLALELYSNGLKVWKIFIISFLAAFFLLPWLSYMAIRVADRAYNTYSSIRPLWNSITRPTCTKFIKLFQSRLKPKVVYTINEYMPLLFDNADLQQSGSPEGMVVSSSHSMKGNYSKSQKENHLSNTTIQDKDIIELIEEAKIIRNKFSPALGVEGLFKFILVTFKSLKDFSAFSFANSKGNSSTTPSNSNSSSSSSSNRPGTNKDYQSHSSPLKGPLHEKTQ